MIEVIALPESKRDWLAELLAREWGSARVVTRGKVHNAARLPALLAELDGTPAAVMTYEIKGKECEIVTLNSMIVGHGAASALIQPIQETARYAACERLWLITTNDNTDALQFYQKRGFHLKAIYPNAIGEARRLKPEIPLTGKNGIPIRDEIELEMRL